MQLANSQQQLQAMQQQLQALQLAMQQRQDIEQVKQDNETKRELMRQTVKAHNIEKIAETKIHDTAQRGIASQNVEEIRALTQLLLKHIDTAQLEREIAARNAEQYSQENYALQDIKRDSRIGM